MLEHIHNKVAPFLSILVPVLNTKMYLHSQIKCFFQYFPVKMAIFDDVTR